MKEKTRDRLYQIGGAIVLYLFYAGCILPLVWQSTHKVFYVVMMALMPFIALLVFAILMAALIPFCACNNLDYDSKKFIKC